MSAVVETSLRASLKWRLDEKTHKLTERFEEVIKKDIGFESQTAEVFVMIYQHSDDQFNITTWIKVPSSAEGVTCQTSIVLNGKRCENYKSDVPVKTERGISFATRTEWYKPPIDSVEIAAEIYIPSVPFSTSSETNFRISRNDNESQGFSFVSTKDGSQHKCHSSILAAASDFCRSLVETEVEGKRKEKAEFPFSGPTLKSVLDFIYFKAISFTDEDDVEEILSVAHMMLLQELMEKCEEKMIECLTEETAFDLFLVARKYDLLNLKTRTLPLMAKNPETEGKIREQGDWELALEFMRFGFSW